MEISDVIYGHHHIDGVLEELIKSAPVQRLKGIYQGGASFLVNQKWNVTRYEHCIGVMLLIKKLGGTIEEQIAGLLHDVSHTAFSHVVDVVFENQAEDYHENIFQQVIVHSEIPDILKNTAIILKNFYLTIQGGHCSNSPHRSCVLIGQTIRCVIYTDMDTLTCTKRKPFWIILL